MAGETPFAKVPLALLEDSEIDSYAVAVYAALRSFCDYGEETGAQVSDAKAARRAGCSPRTFRDRRDVLRSRGWLAWTGKFGAKNRYTVRDQPRRQTPPTAEEDAVVADETAASDAAVEALTAAGDAGGSARNAAVPRREMPTTEIQTESHPRESARGARGGEAKSTAEKDWQLVRRKQRNRRAVVLAQLSDRGKAALEAIGGVEALYDTRPADVRHLRRAFLDAHRNGQPAGRNS